MIRRREHRKGAQGKSSARLQLESAAPTGGESPRALILGAASLFLLIFVAYAPALSADFVWDDDAYVTNNITLRSFDGLRRIWFELGATDQYYPLVFTTFWIEHQLWDDKPVGYHFDNVLLHVSAVVLLWLLLRRFGLPGAWLAAAIFAVHPVHVESVAWVTERKNVLSLVFYLGAAFAYTRIAGLDSANEYSEAARRGSPMRVYLTALALFACALLSKTATVAFPVAMLLVLWWRRGRVRGQDLAPLVPFFAASLLAGLVTSYVEKHHVGAEHLDWTLTLPQRCLLAGRAFWFYAGKLVWPMDLAFIYGRWDIDATDWRQYVPPTAGALTVIALWAMRNRIGRGPPAAAAFFIVTLLPVLGFVNYYFMNYSFVADHFQYLASIGPIALFVALLEWGASRMRTPCRQIAIWGLLAIAGGLLGALTWQRCGVFKNKETLWNDVLAKSPAAAHMAHQNLGMYFFDAGRFDEAARHFLEALRLRPGFPDVHQNLAVALGQLGRGDEAIAHEQEALRLKPDYLDAASNLGLLLMERGRLDEAGQALQRAIQINADSAAAHFNYARLLARQGKAQEAARQYREVLRIDPADAEAARELDALNR